MSDRAKIRARRVTGNDSQQQREIARAIKNAREMALLPYASRVTQPARRQAAADGDAAAARERDRDLPAPATDARRPRRRTSPRGRRRRRRRGRRGHRRGRGGRAARTRRPDEGHPPRRRRPASARRATSSTSPTATPATTSCPRAWPSRPPTGVEAQADAMRRARDVRDASDRGAAEEIATPLVPRVITIAGPGRRRG